MNYELDGTAYPRGIGTFRGTPVHYKAWANGWAMQMTAELQVSWFREQTHYITWGSDSPTLGAL